MMVTNAVLGGIADTVAQTITAVRQRAIRKPGGIKDSDTFAIEIHELDEKNPLSSKDLIPDSKKPPPPFEFERLARFMGYGCLMAPIQLKWFQFLTKCFPITKASGLAPTIKRVAFDQLVFAPAGMLI
jgi:protein Mpv17